MQDEPIIRPIRVEEAPEAKRLIYAIAHPLMEPQMTLEDMDSAPPLHYQTIFLIMERGRG